MKNISFFLILLPLFLIGQVQTKTYLKSTTYTSFYESNSIYSNYSQSLILSDIITTTSGVEIGSININNNILTVSFSESWSSQPLKKGIIKTLTVTPILPTIELGPILTTSGIETGYFAKIENNNLIFYSPIFLTGINTTLTTTINGIPSVNYSVSTGSPYTCPTGGGGGGSGTISIINGVATLNVSGGWSDTCILKTGNIVYLNTSSIPNTELGIIKDSNGVDTNYRAKIENNWLVYYPIQTVPAFPSSGSLNFTQNFGIQPSKQENIIYYDGLGRPEESIGIRAGGDKLKNNLIDWENNWTLSSGGTPFFNQNGATTENERINGLDPYGKNSMLWSCGNDTTSDADGGWNTNLFPVDKTIGYRYTVWVKRTGSQDGYTYHGTQNVNNLNGTANSNPYFWYGDPPQLNQWYLLVGVIHPYTYGGGNSGISGVYDINGNKVITGTDYKWSSTTTTTRFRSYLYYSTDINVKQYFYDPIVQKLDGNEATIEEIVQGHVPNDIVTHIEYDALGRQDKGYLPYAATTNGGAYRTDALTATNSFYNTSKYENTTNPYSQKLFESSPLNRVLEQTAPGTSWKAGTVFDSNGYSNGHTVKFLNQTNTTNEVKLFGVSLTFSSNTYTPTLTGGNAYYTAGELYKTVIKDENWQTSDGLNNTTEEFKDKQGRVVLKRKYADIVVDGVPQAQAKHDTYYVYDVYGNLTYVLSPKMEATTATLSTINSQLNELGYQYKYDNKNRLVEKRIPGKDLEYIVYDNLDRPILTQDANLRGQTKWLFTKYDVFGRVAYTGLFSQNITRDALQTIFNNKTASQNYETKVTTGTGYDNSYYSNDNYPNTNIEILTINYYDDYNFDVVAGTSETSYEVTPLTDVKGLATGSKVKILTTSSWITTVNYYDSKARPIYVYSNNAYLGTTDKVKSNLDFVGKPLEITTVHEKTGDDSITTVDKFTYDHAGRMTKQTQAINGAITPEVIVENHYDELGQLISKGVGGKTSRLQTVDYTYNIRGWLKQINNPSSLGTKLFGFKIGYDEGSNPLYNGNIALTQWKTANIDNSLKTYNYTYDALNRITKAIDNTGHYNLDLVTYDKNGNIINLKRQGAIDIGASTFGIMDDLVYSYDNGNKLIHVLDNGDDNYGFKDLTHTIIDKKTGATVNLDDSNSYDLNGNLIFDGNKGITSITYNYLNLPETITFVEPNTLYGGTNKINYIYDALGQKLSKEVINIEITGAGPTGGTTTTYYAGNYIYEKFSDVNSGSLLGEELKFFNQPEGYVEPSGSTFNYIYQYKDHLGNIRLSYSDSDGNGTISQSEIIREINYYPFGLEHRGYNNVVSSNAVSVANKFMYNNKECENSFGLNFYEMDFRQYDPAVARFTGIDPVTHHSMSTYTAFDNNPIYWADPSGANSVSQGDQTDMWGRARYDQNGVFIPPYARGQKNNFVSSNEENDNPAPDPTDPPVIKDNGDGTSSYTYENGVTVTVNNELISGSSLAVAFEGLLAIGQEAFYSDGKFWLGWNGKFYDFKVTGNGFTGGRISFGKSMSKFLGRTGSILGVYGILDTTDQYMKNEISASRMVQDQIFNFAGLTSTVGAFASFGYNSGYIIEDLCDCNIQLNWYQIFNGRFDKAFDDGKPKPYKSIFTKEFLRK